MRLALGVTIYSRIALSFALNRIFFSANENGTVEQNNQSDFKASLTYQSHYMKMKYTQKPLANLGIKSCDFKMDLIKWQLSFGSSNFGLESYISNRTRAARSLDFEITRMISDQTALHSVQLQL